MRQHKQRTPEQIIERKERERRIETEVVGIAATSVGAGAGVGAIAGLPGVVVGAVIGAAVGALAIIETEQAEHVKAEHEKELDDIAREAASRPRD